MNTSEAQVKACFFMESGIDAFSAVSKRAFIVLLFKVLPIKITNLFTAAQRKRNQITGN